MANPTYYRRLTIELQRSREEGAARLLERTDTGVLSAVPATVHLRAGEKARAIQLAHAFPQLSPKNSAILVATNRPGVIARIGYNNTTRTCRPSGWLARPTDGITEYTDNDPAWVNQTWHWRDGTGYWGKVEEYAHPRVSTNLLKGTTAGPTYGVLIEFTYVWGGVNHVDLGRPDDGKIVQFLLQASTNNLDEAKVVFTSWPYKDDQRESQAAAANLIDNVPTHSGYYSSLPGPRAEISLLNNRLVSDQLTLITCRKRDFIEYDNFSWQRVTGMQVRCHYSTNPAGFYPLAYLGSVYFGDPAESHVRSVAVIPWVAGYQKDAVLSLDAPADSDADVEVLATLI